MALGKLQTSASHAPRSQARTASTRRDGTCLSIGIESESTGKDDSPGQCSSEVTGNREAICRDDRTARQKFVGQVVLTGDARPTRGRRPPRFVDSDSTYVCPIVP